METSAFMGGFYKLLEWISRLAFLNILWISFSLLGLILFGFFPATVAMYSVVRKWMYGKEDVSIFRTFWTAYKQEFVKSNLLGLIIFTIGVILYIDFHFVIQATNSFVSILYIPFLLISFILVCMVFYIFP